jgi:hypothetical protein
MQCLQLAIAIIELHLQFLGRRQVLPSQVCGAQVVQSSMRAKRKQLTVCWVVALCSDTCAALRQPTWVFPLPARICTLIEVDTQLIFWLKDRKVNHVHRVAQHCLCLLHGCCLCAVTAA